MTESREDSESSLRSVGFLSSLKFLQVRDSNHDSLNSCKSMNSRVTAPGINENMVMRHLSESFRVSGSK